MDTTDEVSCYTCTNYDRTEWPAKVISLVHPCRLFGQKLASVSWYFQLCIIYQFYSFMKVIIYYLLQLYFQYILGEILCIKKTSSSCMTSRFYIPWIPRYSTLAMEIQGWALMILILQCYYNLVFIFDYTGSGYLQSSSVFQCQSSSDQSGLVYTPNIPDFYLNDVNAAALWSSDGSFKRLITTERTHIFTIPPESASRNCSGSLVSIQYCYRARDRNINVEQTIFILSSLVSRNEHGLFEVKNITTIRNTPRNSTCTDALMFQEHTADMLWHHNSEWITDTIIRVYIWCYNNWSCCCPTFSFP